MCNPTRRPVSNPLSFKEAMDRLPKVKPQQADASKHHQPATTVPPVVAAAVKDTPPPVVSSMMNNINICQNNSSNSNKKPKKQATSSPSSTRPDSKTRSLYVQHNYHDRSKEPFPAALSSERDWRRINISPTSPFPVRLHHMLECVERDGLSHIVAWQPHGRCFVIHNATEFVQRVLPLYMNGLTKLASFQRQLNLYGFHRISAATSPDRGAYYHEYCLRGSQLGPLTLHIHRIKCKGTGVRPKANPDQEPNFWAMPPVGGSITSTATVAGSMRMMPVPQVLLPNHPEEKEEERTLAIISCDNHHKNYGNDSDNASVMSDITIEEGDRAVLSAAASCRNYQPPSLLSAEMIMSVWGLGGGGSGVLPQQHHHQHRQSYLFHAKDASQCNNNEDDDDDEYLDILMDQMLDQDEDEMAAAAAAPQEQLSSNNHNHGSGECQPTVLLNDSEILHMLHILETMG